MPKEGKGGKNREGGWNRRTSRHKKNNGRLIFGGSLFRKKQKENAVFLFQEKRKGPTMSTRPFAGGTLRISLHKRDDSSPQNTKKKLTSERNPRERKQPRRRRKRKPSTLRETSSEAQEGAELTTGRKSSSEKKTVRPPSTLSTKEGRSHPRN